MVLRRGVSVIRKHRNNLAGALKVASGWMLPRLPPLMALNAPFRVRKHIRRSSIC